MSTTSGARQLIEVLEILGRSLERRNAGELRAISWQGKQRGGQDLRRGCGKQGLSEGEGGSRKM